jgi:hypothetical protein
VHEAARDVDETLQDLLDREVRADREHRVAHLAERGTQSLAHLVASVRNTRTDTA